MGAAMDYTAMGEVQNLLLLFHKLCRKEVRLCNNFLQLWDKLRETLGVQKDKQSNTEQFELFISTVTGRETWAQTRHVHSVKGLRSRWQPCHWVTERTETVHRITLKQEGRQGLKMRAKLWGTDQRQERYRITCATKHLYSWCRHLNLCSLQNPDIFKWVGQLTLYDIKTLDLWLSHTMQTQGRWRLRQPQKTC